VGLALAVGACSPAGPEAAVEAPDLPTAGCVATTDSYRLGVYQTIVSTYDDRADVVVLDIDDGSDGYPDRRETFDRDAAGWVRRHTLARFDDVPPTIESYDRDDSGAIREVETEQDGRRLRLATWFYDGDRPSRIDYRQNDDTEVTEQDVFAYTDRADGGLEIERTFSLYGYEWEVHREILDAGGRTVELVTEDHSGPSRIDEISTWEDDHVVTTRRVETWSDVGDENHVGHYYYDAYGRLVRREWDRFDDGSINEEEHTRWACPWEDV
jgi:hypothetical protein